jgi:flagellar motor protein MotB|tara:strand:+ start:5274 stop:5648 length:375 start_codon:yes stop_codon:yes gene_type:complete
MLTSQEIKRQIIASAKTSPFRKAMEKPDNPMSDGERMEAGKALEAMTKTVGWALVSQHMQKKMNLISLITDQMPDAERAEKRVVASAFIELEQFITTMIELKDKLLEKERSKHEAKNVSKDEEE